MEEIEKFKSDLRKESIRVFQILMHVISFHHWPCSRYRSIKLYLPWKNRVGVPRPKSKNLIISFLSDKYIFSCTFVFRPALWIWCRINIVVLFPDLWPPLHNFYVQIWWLKIVFSSALVKINVIYIYISQVDYLYLSKMS